MYPLRNYPPSHAFLNLQVEEIFGQLLLVDKILCLPENVWSETRGSIVGHACKIGVFQGQFCSCMRETTV